MHYFRRPGFIDFDKQIMPNLPMKSFILIDKIFSLAGRFHDVLIFLKDHGRIIEID